ncbi:MAG: ATP-binding cassette domain-containing protein [Holosporales bacterium]|jgi:putative ABC transport system ATP-binding protein|nr:ATP-binding cassette domain-containing protein [Holosporales bacterium]
MLQLKNITVRNVLHNLNLTVDTGDFILLIGENGAGKTTLFNTISGDLIPKSGSIIIDGRDVTCIPQHKRAVLVSSVLQDPRSGTVGGMTLRENLHIAYTRGKRRHLKISNSCLREDLYKEKLSLLGMNLENRLDEYVENLSGGQRQALSIILSIIADSKIILLDEITAALDAKSSYSIMEIVDKTIRQGQKTCLMITHDISHTTQFGDKVLLLKKGTLKEANPS